MTNRSQCRHCRTALPSEAKYCSQCGTAQALMILDPLGLEDAPVSSGADIAPHARLKMLAGLALLFAMLAVLWGLSRDFDPTDGEPLSSETPEEGILAADPGTSTTLVTSTTSTTTSAPTVRSGQLFMNGVQGPVLGDGVEGVLVQLIGRTMRQIDLSTGAIESIALEHPVYSDEGQSGIVVHGNVVALSGSAITITDLSDGSQHVPGEMADGSFEGHVAGPAGVDSIWLASHPEPDRISEAIELDVEGEVRRRLEVPHPFEIRWAEGDQLILESPDGSFRHDTVTGATVRMPGAIVAFGPGLVITASCEESLQCDVLVDRGSGAQVVDWLSASDEFDGLIDLSPDLTGALLHVYSQFGAEHIFIDLTTGSRVDLGRLPIDPYRGVVWVEGSRWIIGQDQSSNLALAINTATGTQVDLVLPSHINFPSVLAFIPSN